jgi:hypothetical protein
MDKLMYGLLAEVYGGMEAELVKSYLAAHGIGVELFQETVGQNIYPTTVDMLGHAQIFVKKINLKRQLFFSMKLNSKESK